ncbi:MAG TPA: hypothetical protein VJ748_07245 [Vitreimonas sp.]|jgi:hypothetical protein|nr:hypothetical protein [Vitreimonas sp.]
MRILLALAAAATLGLSACAREADTSAAEPDTGEELAEAGEAVGDAAVEVGEAARVAITDAAEEVDENTEPAQEPEATSPTRAEP